MSLGDTEAESCKRLIQWAIEEDLGEEGDLTSQAVIPESLQGSAELVARSPGVLAGRAVIELLIAYARDRGQDLTFSPIVQDGSAFDSMAVLGELHGNMRELLQLERIVLNFLQRLSGIASLTHRYREAIGDLGCKILDTRKTTPGWRLLEKYAVRCGGGTNHRIGLFDGVMIKDNHLATFGDQPDAITKAVQAARESYGKRVPIEVEVDTLEQLEEALQAKPDIILLDNMSIEQLTEAVRQRDRQAPDIMLEASGGVNLATVRGIAETGVDCISVGALTHSALALDIGLDYRKA